MLWLEQARKEEQEFIRRQNEERHKKELTSLFDVKLPDSETVVKQRLQDIRVSEREKELSSLFGIENPQSVAHPETSPLTTSQIETLIPGLPDIKNVNDAVQWVESNERLWADCESRGDLESLRRFKTPERLVLVDRCRRFVANTSIPVTYTPPPVPERAAHPGQFWQPKTNAPYTYAVNPALTKTAPNPQVVQWKQGNTLIMRPENRELMPGEPTRRVRILR